MVEPHLVVTGGLLLCALAFALYSIFTIETPHRTNNTTSNHNRRPINNYHQLTERNPRQQNTTSERVVRQRNTTQNQRVQQLTNTANREFVENRQENPEICRLCQNAAVESIVKQKCGHVYHSKCFQEWEKEDKYCLRCVWE